MKKLEDKQIYRLGIGVLAVIAVVLVFAISTQVGGVRSLDDLTAQMETENVSVEAITQDNQGDNVVVPEIKPTTQPTTESTIDEQFVIAVPMPKEPDKPELEAPDSKPETHDNLNDPSKVPTYNDKDVVKEVEKVTVAEEKKTNEPVKNKEESAIMSLVQGINFSYNQQIDSF